MCDDNHADDGQHLDTSLPGRWSDGVSAAEVQGQDGLVWTITSPNMDFIPQPITGIIRVRLMTDGRYGTADPVQYPQLLESGFEFLSSVYRRAPDNHPYHPMWTIPLESSHFEYISGSTIRCLGLLSTDFVDPMSTLVDTTSLQARQHLSRNTVDDRHHLLWWLESAMRHARDRLRTFASTFRDAVLQCAQLQRYWLMCEAFMLFDRLTHHISSPYSLTATTVRRNLMGAFTTSPETAQRLSQGGIPVWFLRPKSSLPPLIHLAPLQGVRPPHNICTTPADLHGIGVYFGLAGSKHVQATCRCISLYHDISRTPLLVVEDDQWAPMPQRQYKRMTSATSGRFPDLSSTPSSVIRRSRAYQPYPRVDSSHLRGRDKFVDVQHEWMPPTAAPWDEAMQLVSNGNRTAQARPSAEIWGYWIPEPSLLLNSQTRRERYLRNWLRARHGWLYLLRIRGSSPTTVPPQWWRDFLYDTGTTRLCTNDSSRTAKRKAMISHVFDGVFQEDEIDLDARSPITWFHHHVDQLSHDICPLIIWEMFELGFRYELLALDRYLVPSTADDIAEVMREDLLSTVFPNGGIYALETLPSQGTGLCASLVDYRIPALEALRRVVVRWPSCPSHIQNAIPLALNIDRHYICKIERDIALFYVATFFRYSGRAPLVPHKHPSYLESTSTNSRK